MSGTKTVDKMRDGTKYGTVIQSVDESNHYGRLLAEVGKNKQVLELGCSTGFLSEAMTTLNGCSVTAIEIDPECASTARGKCQRVIVADLDSCDLQDVLKGEKFDVVLCADVLEHLRDPARVLRDLRQSLAEDGYVVASIPNISHGSVRLALFIGQFPYRPMGLLDDTHIKFFNRALLEGVFESAGYRVSIVGRNRWSIFDTEIGHRLPKDFSNTILEPLNRDPESETYQFIVRAFPYTMKEALGDRQRALAMSLNIVKQSSESNSSSGPAGNTESLPAIDCVILNEQTTVMDDRYNANFKGLNYPHELLRYHTLQVHQDIFASENSLIDDPPLFRNENRGTFRFVRSGNVDTTASQPYPLALNSQPVGAAESVIEKLKTNVRGELVFLCDTQIYPTAGCLLALVTEQRKSHSEDVSFAVPEITTSPANESGKDWKCCFIVNRELFMSALSELSRTAQKLTLESISSALRKSGAKFKPCLTSNFFFIGPAGKEQKNESRALTVPQSDRSIKRSETTTQLYLDLMEKCLLNQIYEDSWTDWNERSHLQKFDAEKRLLGRDWPSAAHTMIGLLRLRNIRTLLETVLREDIPGDIIETGVWRGGACIYVRAILEAHGIKDRRVFVADSFEGLPPPDPSKYPADAGDVHHKFEELAVSLEQVQSNFSKYGLLDNQVVFLKGWFKDTLPSAPIERLALLRLDGDMYESTMDSLNNLYHKVSPGGFIIVDDYGLVPNCKKAIHDFRAQHGITAPIQDIDGCGAFWRREPLTIVGTLPNSPPLLEPVLADHLTRPFWTVIVPVHNRLNYLERCLNSILEQDPGPEAMEIIVHDDCSDIDIKTCVERLGKGRIRYYRTKTRLGLYGNTNEALKRSSGTWVHVLHDDDFVIPPFYETMRKAVEHLPETVGVACSHYTNIHESDGSTWSPPPFLPEAGIWTNLLETVAIANPLNIPAVVIRRAVFEKIGTFSADLDYTGDWEFYIRSAANYQWWYQPANLARFSVHEGSLTRELEKSGQTAVNIRLTIDRASRYLPPRVVANSLSKARLQHGTTFLALAHDAFNKGNPKLAIKLAKECAALSKEIASTPEFMKLLQLEEAAELRMWAACPDGI